MPRSQAEVRWAFANQKKDPYAKEVVAKVHAAGPGSVKKLPEHTGTANPRSARAMFGKKKS